MKIVIFQTSFSKGAGERRFMGLISKQSLESQLLGNLSERWWKVAIFEGEHAKNPKILKKIGQNEVKK